LNGIGEALAYAAAKARSEVGAGRAFLRKSAEGGRLDLEWARPEIIALDLGQVDAADRNAASIQHVYALIHPFYLVSTAFFP
jgi:hypothetical protein